MEPPVPQGPPPEKPQGSVRQPLLINAGLMLVLYAVASAVTNGKADETAFFYFCALVGLFVLNVLAAIVLAFMGRRQSVFGVIYSGIGIFLIGLGSCALVLNHMHVN